MSEDLSGAHFMQRAIELAQLGLGSTSPNPLVGCVIVRDDRIIGEGYHREYGKAHAEVNAVNSVADPQELKGATVYVTLEPCSFHGNTPPCADLLVRHEVGKVIIATRDPHPKVNGSGIERLTHHGISVEEGLGEDEYRMVNRRFFTFHEQSRPHIILKWAQTSDGFIARENFDSKWISNSKSRQLVHKWRSEEDAILVGKNTAIYDDPSLTVRDWTGNNPIRVLVDFNLAVPETHHLFDDQAETLIFNGHRNQIQGSHEWIKIPRDSLEMSILKHLFEKKITSVIIEGGARTLKGFISQGLWDEARIFESSQTFGSGIDAPGISGNLIEQKDVEGDKLSILSNH